MKQSKRFQKAKKTKSNRAGVFLMDNKKLEIAILDAALDANNPAGENYRSLTLAKTGDLASSFALSARIVEQSALETGVIPERYQRSVGTVGIEGQIRLLKATVGIVGAGGLGGFVLELLARMGVGRLVIVDDDTFSDSNLNRQLLAEENNLGESKADTAVRRIAAVNSSVEVTAHNARGDLSTMPLFFSGCDLVLDCLDNLPSRFELEKACSQLGVVMIHGAIAGFLGQLAVIRPDRPLLKSIYGSVAESGVKKGVEIHLGNPAATPAMLAAWQASEAVKFLAGLDGVLPPDKLLIIDMQAGESYQVEVEVGA
jgi:molybdopterin-synthase adenylyltransferase